MSIYGADIHSFFPSKPIKPQHRFARVKSHKIQPWDEAHHVWLVGRKIYENGFLLIVLVHLSWGYYYDLLRWKITHNIGFWYIEWLKIDINK